MSKIVLEVCVDLIESALAAEEGGADRIELCADLNDGGITPSRGVIELLIKKLTIPVNVLIRPRSGDFFYSDLEFEAMKYDIEFVKSTKANGVVFGILNNNGTIDNKRNEELIRLAEPLSTTFHRAFDFTPDPLEALKTLIDLRFDRILTSGQKLTVPEGKELISRLVKEADDRIIIMPGGDVNENNIGDIITTTGVREIHSSASIIKNNSVINDSIIPGRERRVTSTEKVKAMITVIKNL